MRPLAQWGKCCLLLRHQPLQPARLIKRQGLQAALNQQGVEKTLIELLGAIKAAGLNSSRRTSPLQPPHQRLLSRLLISVVKQLKIEHLSCGHKIICFSFYCFPSVVFPHFPVEENSNSNNFKSLFSALSPFFVYLNEKCLRSLESAQIVGSVRPLVGGQRS